MAETVALFRCVCGADIPFIRGREVHCTRRGRRHNPGAMSQARMETVVLSKSRVPPAGGAAPADRPSLTGRSFDHFQILEELGQGGVGTVYRALDTSLHDLICGTWVLEDRAWT